MLLMHIPLMGEMDGEFCFELTGCNKAEEVSEIYFGANFLLFLCLHEKVHHHGLLLVIY